MISVVCSTFLLDILIFALCSHITIRIALIVTAIPILFVSV